MNAPTSPPHGPHDRLARWIRAPVDPPDTPPGAHEWARHFRPAESFLRYLKLTYLFTVGAVSLVAIPLVVGLTLGILTEVESPLVSAVLLALVLGGLALPGLLGALAGYLLLRLRFDTTWYVLTDRALRVRRGILTIQEQTVTLDNVQNVKVKQGPIQRWLGIANVTVETAASGVPTGQSGGISAGAAVIEGVTDAHELRDRIRDRMRRSRSQGIGDRGGREGAGAPLDEGGGESRDREPHGTRGQRTGPASPGPVWTREHLAALREVHREVKRL